jgi:hypothetical protein
VQAYYLYLEGWDAVNAFSPTYRETVRGHITPQAFVHLWGDCHVVLDGQLEQLLRDCVAGGPLTGYRARCFGTSTLTPC